MNKLISYYPKKVTGPVRPHTDVLKKGSYLLVLWFAFVTMLSCEETRNERLRLWYDEPASEWTEALPLGNGRIGAMVFGGLEEDRIQFNEETLWTGEPREYSRKGASDHLQEIRRLIFEGKQDEAEELAQREFMGLQSNAENYPAELAAWLNNVNSVEYLKYASTDFDDSDWGMMKFPAKEGWESIGFDWLDGSVWLRFSFDLPTAWVGKELILNLGRIRDEDITYFNGQQVGAEKNRNAHRRYEVGTESVRNGKNTIAIRVLNFYDKGGMVGFKTGEPMTVYPKGAELPTDKTDPNAGIPLDVEWRYFVQNDTPPEYPQYQASYQPFGDLWLRFDDHEQASNYQRELDLENAISTTSYEINGIKYKREYLISALDQVMAVRLTASEQASISLSAGLSSRHKSSKVRQLDAKTIQLDAEVQNGALRGVSILKAMPSGGQLSVNDNELVIKDADEVILYLTAATNFVKYDQVTGDPDSLTLEAMSKVANKSFSDVLEEHKEDYRQYFDRFAVDFADSDGSNMTTDERVKRFAEQDDPALVALYMQYGRYLLISSSRPGSQPANLQGIWNDELTPPWGSKYTTNINLEMNYWPAEPLNLPELQEPLFQMISEIAEQGAKTAKNHYDADGWVLHHNTDLWRGTAPINNSNHGIWPTGGAWLCHQLWEHYLYSLDTTFLKENAYPLMKGAARFFVDFLIEDPKTGYLISTPSNSPENGGLVAAPTMDHQLIRDLFSNCIAASKVLNSESEFDKQLQTMLPGIAPNLIGQHGQLQEWLEDIDNPDNKHRHVSHLWGLHPGNEINPNTPELMDAAEQSLLFRGDDGTGWSLAWKINFWARLKDGDHAWLMIKNLFRPAWGEDKRGGGSYANLFDAHPPFQIDGNFGASAGIAEMIVQSQNEVIELLPALPTALPNGHIKGLKARHGLSLDIQWEDGQLSTATVISGQDQNRQFVYAGDTVNVKLSAGVQKVLPF